MDREFWAAAVISFVLACGIAVVTIDHLSTDDPVVRAQGSGCDITYTPDGPLHEAHRPDHSCVYHNPELGVKYSYTINEDGFRGEPVDPDATYTTVMIGDSHTFGWGVNDSATVPALLDERLDGHPRIEDAQVINAGILSYGMEDHRLMLQHRIVPLRPDRVIVLFTWRDVLGVRIEEQFLDEIRDEQGTDDGENSPRIDELLGDRVESYRDRQREQIIAGTSPIFDEMERITEIARNNSIDLAFFAYEPMTPDLRRAFATWSDREGADLFFAPRQFRSSTYDEMDYTVSPDDNHYNQLGNSWLAGHIYDSLEWPDHNNSWPG